METNCVHEFAHAKLNLSLKVLSKLPNSYHNIESYITFLPDLYDHLIIKKSKKNKIFINGKFAKALKDKGGDTLITNSIKLLSDLLKININLKIHVKKNIPLGSGLGGGSADAAAVVRAIIKLYKLNNKKKIIKDNLYQIGSDVPVCFYSKNAKVSNIGDIVKPLRILEKKLWVLLIKPNSFYSTKYIFANFRDSYEKKSRFSYTLNNIIKDMNKYKNSLENTVCKVENNIGRIITNLSSNDSLTMPRISGSGSVIFVVFKTKEALYNYQKKLNVNRRDHWIKATYIEL